MKKLAFILSLTMVLVFLALLSYAATVNYLPRDGEIGSVNDYRNLYAAQIFDAKPGLLETLTFEMKYQTASQSANDVPGNDLQFRVLLAETQQVAGGTWQPNNIIFQSTSMTLPGSPEHWEQFTVDFGGIDLVDSTKYAFVIDTFSDADNIYSKALFGRSLLTGGPSGTDFLYAGYGYSNAILIGTDIESHWQQNGWNTISPSPSSGGIAYRMEYTNVPSTINEMVTDIDPPGVNPAYWTGDDMNNTDQLKNADPRTEEYWLKALLGKDYDDPSVNYIDRILKGTRGLGLDDKSLTDFDPDLFWTYAVVKYDGMWIAYENNGINNLLTTDIFRWGISHITFFGPSSVPEPATMLLLGLGLIGLAGARRKIQK